jgi:cytidyltransferase-like protein
MKSFLDFLFEKQNSGKTIVIFPGRFQPFHKGHKALYDKAKKKFPQADFYIATSDIKPELVAKDPSRYPFTFDEKKQIITATGVPEGEIVKTNQPYKPLEILQNYNKDIDKVIFVVGLKDMLEDPRFSFKPLKSGASSYFQPYKDNIELKAFGEGGHGYIYAPGTITFSIDGEASTSASQLREIYKTADPKKRMRIVVDVVGRPDTNIFNLFNKKLN